MPPDTAPHAFAALRTHASGEPRSRVERLRVDDLTDGELIVRTRYAGVNYKDCLAIHGQARIIRHHPRIAGIEAVGEVMDSASSLFPPGTQVLIHGFQTGIDFDGGFAERMRVPVDHAQRVPAGLTSLETAVLGVPGFSVALALDGFEQRGITPDSGLVAVSGAGGAVGLMAIALLSRRGYRVAAITRRSALAPTLRALGAVEVLGAGDAAEARRPLETPRFAAAIDNVGGGVLSWLLRSMQDGGCVASVGNAGGNDYPGSVLPFIVRRVQLCGVVANAPWPQRLRLWNRLAGDLRPDFDLLMPHVQRISLEALPGHAEQQLRGETSGRTLVDHEYPS